MIKQSTKIKRGTEYLYNGKSVWVERQKSRDEVLVCEAETLAVTDLFFTVDMEDLKPIKSQPTVINKVSEARKQEDKIYNTLKKVFLENHTACELRLKGCTKKATEVHHLFSGASRSKYYLVVSEWKSACRNCHDKVHNYLSKDEAMALGLKKME